MAKITQTISTVTSLPTPPNPNSPSTFDALAYPYTVAQNAFGVDVNDMATELNTFATQANAVKDEVNTARDDAVTAKEAAELARDEAVGAVATLPDGIINDSTVSATDTWSSKKIDADKQDTLVSGTNIKTIGGASILGSGNLLFGVTDYQEFTTSGTWTKPAGINYVYVECFGGGGGGSLGSGTSNVGGGAGGECIFKTFFAIDVPSSVSVVVGSGGGGVTNIGASGINGGFSEFGTLIKAYGGRGGFYSTTVVGSMRDANNTYNDFSYIYSPFFGVSGRTNVNASASLYGGGGGAGCGTGYFSGGVSEFAGNGGSSSNIDSPNTNGSFPSGGGGATNGTSTISGSGANGCVRVWCW